MKQVLLFVGIVIVFGCHSRKENNSDLLKVVVAQTKRFTDSIHKESYSFRDSLLETVSGLFMKYYSAGYMDGANNIVDLYNEKQLTDEAIEQKRKVFFAKMRTQLASRKQDVKEAIK